MMIPTRTGKDDTYGLGLTKNFIKDNHFGATGILLQGIMHISEMD